MRSNHVTYKGEKQAGAHACVNFANIDSVAIQPVKGDVKEQMFGNGYIAQELRSGQLPLRGVRVLVCPR